MQVNQSETGSTPLWNQWVSLRERAGEINCLLNVMPSKSFVITMTTLRAGTGGCTNLSTNTLKRPQMCAHKHTQTNANNPQIYRYKRASRQIKTVIHHQSYPAYAILPEDGEDREESFPSSRFRRWTGGRKDRKQEETEKKEGELLENSLNSVTSK